MNATNQNEAVRFLTALDPSAVSWTFQTFDDDKERKDENLVRVLHGTLAEHWPTLTRLNEQGAGVFVTVNETDGNGRKKENITRVRAVFVDLDGAPIEPVLSNGRMPHVVVESSAGRWHAYWLVAGLPLDQFTPIQKTLINAFSGDTSVHDLPRVMRLPGLLHRKGDHPYLTRIVSTSAAPPYAPTDFPRAEPESVPNIGSHSANEELEAWYPGEFAYAMKVLPNPPELERSEWIRIGLACHAATGGSDEGFALFDEWSKKWSGYNSRNTRKAWKGFRPTGITAATIFHLANERVPGWREAYAAAVDNGWSGGTIESGTEQTVEAPKDEAPKAEAPKSKKDDSLLPLHWHGEPWSLDSQWLIKGLIPEKGAGLLSGQWGTAKTFCALDLAASVMTEQPFAGRKIARKGGVLFIAAEGSGQIKKRLAGLAEFKFALGGQTLPFVWVEECPPLLGQNAGPILIDTAKVAARELKAKFGLPLVLIMVDTLAAAAGFKDESAAAEGQRAMNVLQALSRATGALALAVDHFGKDEERGTRGTSAKEASSDFILAFLGRKELNGAISDTRMAVRKVREGRVGYEIPFKLKEVTLGNDRDGEAVTTCVVEWGTMGDYQPKPKRPAKSLTDLNTALTATLNEHGEQQTTDNGQSITAVRREDLLRSFKRSYRGEPRAARTAFGRALKEAGDTIVVFEVGDEQFIGRPLEEL